MIPEKELIINEYLVRDMQLLSQVKLTKKGLIRYLCLSLGLVQLNESRTLIFDIVEALLYFHFNDIEPTAKDIEQKVNSLREKKASFKSIMYHLLQLKKKGIITKKENRYVFVIPSLAENKELGPALEQIYLENIKLAFEKIKKAIEILKTMKD
ncbi:MAG: hypothetical protein N3D10_00400 [Candidatus Micrarchaeota archaeon]|nr:hypothetical protein [Candidatus Micrarchaeota archaeon]